MLAMNIKVYAILTDIIAYGGVSEARSILKVDIIVKILSDVKQPWKFAKTAEAGKKEHQTGGDKFRGKRKRVIKEIKDVQAAKKVALESESKVSHAYNTKPYRLKRNLKINCG